MEGHIRASLQRRALRITPSISHAVVAESPATPNKQQLSPATEEQWLFPDLTVRPRLEEHYRQTLLEDVLALSYDHFSPHADLALLESGEVGSNEWLRSVPTLKGMFTMPLSQLPTQPQADQITTSLITLEATSMKAPSSRLITPTRAGHTRWRKKVMNPIDYTPVPKETMELFWNPPPPPPPPFAPIPSRLPMLKSVSLRMFPESTSDKGALLPAVMAIECITGLRADPLVVDRADNMRRLRMGMTMGVGLTLTGGRMYEFVDKLVQCVLPLLQQWTGIEPDPKKEEETDEAGRKPGPRANSIIRRTDADPGTVTFVLPKRFVGMFPDIEPYFDQFPKMYDLEIAITTTATTRKGAVLVLSGFQLPFLIDESARYIDAEEVRRRREAAAAKAAAAKADPWAQYRKKR
ncbi:ribosomal protein L5 domain-containing protein [Cladochytrium replicatum]|nr:ribosomal protein L5 domain-containing protein [Cladochytrium replicatum]